MIYGEQSVVVSSFAAKYVPLTPRSGEYVITSIKPPIMKTIRGIKLLRILIQSGVVLSTKHIIVGINKIMMMASPKNILPYK